MIWPTTPAHHAADISNDPNPNLHRQANARPRKQAAERTQGLLEGIGNHVAIAGDGLTIDLVSPASIVLQMLNGLRHR